ncbi:hypothetical protein [Streptomyces curacoi]|uniref:Uncharacterized protein n=1 Tax=Streptomyces curacoi TaxID=146536 RepID=A0A117P397_9ACTN|nr:hypothetical protein [Streptomyces curacoi]KUM72279.1 hypothetical protein AQI70_23530 [Streptomyces curacoi]
MSRRAKGWLFGGWLVLVVAGWSFTESINDGIEPTSGPRPKPSPSSSLSGCSPPTPTPSVVPSADPERGIADFYVNAEPDRVATAVVCTTSD